MILRLMKKERPAEIFTAQDAKLPPGYYAAKRPEFGAP